MIKTYHYKELTWLDLESPTREEVRNAMETYNLDPVVCEDLMNPSVKPHVDRYSNCIYLTLRFPSLARFTQDEESQEIDFVIGHTFIITTHYDALDPLHAFSKLFEVSSILNKSSLGDHAGFIFFYMLRELYKSISEELDTIKKQVMQAESKIFKGEEKRMVIELSKLNRHLLSFKEATNSHKSVLDSFEAAGKEFFGPEFEPQLKMLSETQFAVHSQIQDSRDYLKELQTTNDSLLSHKQNDTMKTFTVLAFVFLPLSFISSLFLNAEASFPSFAHPQVFWVFILAMAVFALSAIILFRYKKWL